jgi:hypothetical protein
LAVAPKKWRKKQNFNATQFSATFQRTFEHTSSSFTLNEVLPLDDMGLQFILGDDHLNCGLDPQVKMGGGLFQPTILW